jgi:hypothetical protein
VWVTPILLRTSLLKWWSRVTESKQFYGLDPPD